MTLEKQTQIASSFSDKFEVFSLDIKLTKDEFQLFDKGIFANGMDEKWNIFVLDSFMYWARSWTDNCIFKILITRQSDSVTLEAGYVTRDRAKFTSDDIEHDKILFLRILQMYLGRDDIYNDPEFEFELVKQTLSQHDPNNECKKSIGHNDVGLTKQIHDAMTRDEQKKYYDVFGWTELRSRILSKNDNEPLLSLYLQNKKSNSAVTYYFDKDAKELLGQIIIKTKLSSR